VQENETGQIQIRYREQCLPFREVLHASTARSEGRGAVECTLGLRHEVNGVVAVRCKITTADAAITTAETLLQANNLNLLTSVVDPVHVTGTGAAGTSERSGRLQRSGFQHVL
jgi:hypothetical protein